MHATQPQQYAYAPSPGRTACPLPHSRHHNLHRRPPSTMSSLDGRSLRGVASSLYRPFRSASPTSKWSKWWCLEPTECAPSATQARVARHRQSRQRPRPPRRPHQAPRASSAGASTAQRPTPRRHCSAESPRSKAHYASGPNTAASSAFSLDDSAASPSSDTTSVRLCDIAASARCGSRS